MPSNIEGFYWLASAVTYQGGNILSLFLISLLLNSHKFEFPTTVHITGGCLIVLAAVGSNETVMLIILAILVIGTFITVYMKHPASLLWKIVLITGIIGAVIVVIAPGNAVRASEAADKHLFLQSLLNSIIWTSRYLFTWTLDVGLLSASLLFFPIAVSLNNHSDFYRFHKKHLFLFLIVWLSLIILTFFPCFWALGRMGGLRITNTAYLIFLIGWFLSIFFFVNVFIKDTKSDVVIHKYVLVAAEIILIIGLLGRGNFRPALQDLIFHAPSYNRQLNERYSIIKQSLEQKITHIEVPALKGPLPTTICRVQWWAEDDNITTNPNDWRNQSFAGFFNAESIIAVFPEKKEKNSSGGGAK